jgi:hypothetical protein
MNSKLRFVHPLTCASLLLVTAACIKLKVVTTVFQPAQPCPCPGEVMVDGPKPPIQIFDPGGISGSLTIGLGLGGFTSGNAGQTCFPASQGWDSWFVLPRLLLGPNTAPDANSYTNSENSSQFTVKTCDPDNGQMLQTGIVIQRDIPPFQKTCYTNSTVPPCTSTNLTIAVRTGTTQGKYRATVFFKSSTTNGLPSGIKVYWSYP